MMAYARGRQRLRDSSLMRCSVFECMVILLPERQAADKYSRRVRTYTFPLIDLLSSWRTPQRLHRESTLARGGQRRSSSGAGCQ